MKTLLRKLAVVVDEPQSGRFAWALLESTEDATVFIQQEAGPDSFGTWEAAFDDGVVALMRLVDDQRVGPRAIAQHENEDEDPVG